MGNAASADASMSALDQQTRPSDKALMDWTLEIHKDRPFKEAIHTLHRPFLPPGHYSVLLIGNPGIMPERPIGRQWSGKHGMNHRPRPCMAACYQSVSQGVLSERAQSRADAQLIRTSGRLPGSVRSRSVFGTTSVGTEGLSNQIRPRHQLLLPPSPRNGRTS